MRKIATTWRSLILGVFLVGAVSAQVPLGGLPHWASANPVLWPPGVSSAWDSVPPGFRVVSESGVIRSGGEYYQLRSYSLSGTLALYFGVNEGGVDTGFDEVLFADFCKTPPNLAQGSVHSLIWSGRKPNGRFGLGILPLPDAGPASIDLSHSHVPAFEAPPGEILLTCGTAFGKIYFLNASTSTIGRLVPSGASFQHDAGFAVTVPYLKRSVRRLREPVPPSGFSILYFPAPANPLVFLDRHTLPTFNTEWDTADYIAMVNGVPALVSEPNPNQTITKVGLRNSFVAGLSTVAVQGPQGHVVWLEKGPTSAGPWTQTGNKATTRLSTQFLLLRLFAPLAEGGFLRLVDATTSSTGPVFRVPGAHPTVHGVEGEKIGAMSAGSTVTVHGGNWPSPLTVTYIEVLSTGGAMHHALAPTNVGPERFDIIVPNIAARGLLKITGAGTGLLDSTDYWISITQ